MEGLQDMDSWSSCWWLLVALAFLSWYIIMYCYHDYHWTYIIIVYYCHLLSLLLMMTRRRRTMPWPSGGLSARHEGHRGWDKIPSSAMKETCKMVVKIAIENYRCFLSQEPYLLSDVTTSKAKKNTATISYPSIVKHGWEISEPAVKEALLAGKIIEVSCG